MIAGLLAFGAGAGVTPLAAQVSAAGPGAFAGATTLTFDDAPAGAPLGTRYAGAGVTFSRDDAGPVVANAWGPVRSTVSNPNVLATPGGPGGVPIFASHVNLLFSTPHTALGAYFGNDQSTVYQAMRLSVFGGGGLIGSVDVIANHNTSFDQFIGLTSTVPFTQARFEVLQSAPTWAAGLDDVMFTPAATVVPEPGAVVLLGTGLLVLAAGTRRRRRSVG